VHSCLTTVDDERKEENEMAKDERINRRGRESAVNSAIGGLLSWVAGKDSVKRGTSPADGAMGELLSWVTGKGGKKDNGVR
jgi:hypothetical protein